MEETAPAAELQLQRDVSSESLAPPGDPSRKRKGKTTRWNIPKHALQTLEQIFLQDKFPSVETRKTLATDLKVTPRQVQVWFQNKRQRSQKPLSPADAEPQQMLSTSVSAPHRTRGCPCCAGSASCVLCVPQAMSTSNPSPLLCTCLGFSCARCDAPSHAPATSTTCGFSQDAAPLRRATGGHQGCLDQLQRQHRHHRGHARPAGGLRQRRDRPGHGSSSRSSSSG